MSTPCVGCNSVMGKIERLDWWADEPKPVLFARTSSSTLRTLHEEIEFLCERDGFHCVNVAISSRQSGGMVDVTVESKRTRERLVLRFHQFAGTSCDDCLNQLRSWLSVHFDT